MGVRRLAGLLGAVFLVWAGVFAWTVGRQPPESPAPAEPGAPTAAALFERHCTSCHDLADMRAKAGPAGDASRRAELERFLEGHTNANAAENGRILDYLARP